MLALIFERREVGVLLGMDGKVLEGGKLSVWILGKLGRIGVLFAASHD
jgi:hypothetical protein